MEFLGIGPLELLFVLIIALIILGPNDMIKAGKTIGRTLRKIVTSPNWRAIQDTSREIRQLPNRLMREAGLEELQKDLPRPEQIMRESGLNEVKENLSNVGEELSDWTTPPQTIGSPPPPKPPETTTPSEPNQENTSKD